MTKKEHIKNIYLAIKEISDIEFQKRVWVEGKGPEISSYEEVMSVLYDDFNFNLFLENYKKINLPLDLYDKLKKLDHLLENFQSPDLAETLLYNKNWLNIIDFAGIIVSAFENDIFNFGDKIKIFYSKTGFEFENKPELLILCNSRQLEHFFTLLRFSINQNVEQELLLVNDLFDKKLNIVKFYNTIKQQKIIKQTEINTFLIIADKYEWDLLVGELLFLARNTGLKRIEFNSGIDLIWQCI